jgi:nifR3 family TIM-barrel protein
MPAPEPALRIGPRVIAPALVLAPMSGVTDSPFRRMVKAASGRDVGMVVSEFISVEMLTRKELRAQVRLAFSEAERPVAIQIYGAEPERMAEAARIVEDAGADLVDINCGCPAPKIVRRGGGAGLLKDLPRLGRIVDTVRSAVRIPVTIKIRNGWCAESINAMHTLRVAEESGAMAVAVHGRTRVQLYTGVADWEVVRALKAEARIPVIGCGDIQTPEAALGRLRETGCDAVMIGRGAILNPWIFAQIGAILRGEAVREPSWGERLALLGSYREALGTQYPGRVVPGRLKMMLSRLVKGFHGAHELRLEALRMDDPDAMLAHLAARLADVDHPGQT